MSRRQPGGEEAEECDGGHSRQEHWMRTLCVGQSLRDDPCGGEKEEGR